MYILNDKLYDTPGRTQSPYIEQTAFAAAATEELFQTSDGVVKFVFQQSCFYSNSLTTITGMYIDADDGLGYRQVQWGTSFTCNYSSEGDKDFKVKVKLSDNSYLYCHFTLTLEIEPTLKSTYYSTTETLNINALNVSAYNGQKASGEVTIIYNSTVQELDKPLIVFEGYDVWKIMTPDSPDRNFSWEDLIDQYSPMGYFPQSFQSSLKSRGYDIVFVDFENGTDYIQRNAFFAEAVIDAVNQKKSGSEPNVVMGISMGGLVARYALAHMEANSEDHDTRLFISMDSPHQGANVPLGLQAMVRHLTDVKVEVGYAPFDLTGKVWDIGSTYPDYAATLSLLQQPATRQMLIQQLSGFGENLYIDNSVHTTFMQEYEQLGYPKQCRNIAVSNGSGSTSTSWQLIPGSQIFKLDASCSTPWWTGFLGGFITASSVFVKQLWEMPLITISSILVGNYRVNADFEIKALPTTGITKIYDGEIKISKKVFWLIPITSTLTSESVNYTGDNKPWSSAQGGYMSFSDYTQYIPPNLPSCLSIEEPPEDNFCFVPEVSALDIQGTLDLLNGYTTADELPKSMFDNFYTEPTSNVFHTRFNSGNTNWILLELDEDPTILQQSFVNKFNGCELSGPDIVCSTGATFSISDIPSGVTLLWNKSSNLSEDSNGDDYVVMKATSSGEGWVQAQLSGGGTNVFSEQKSVWAGKPKSSDITIDAGGYLYACDYTYADAQYRPVIGENQLYEYEWDLPNASDWDIMEDRGSPIDMEYVEIEYYEDPAPSSEIISVRALNQCDWSDWASISVSVMDNCYYMMMSPNPTSGETTLTIEEGSPEETTLKSASIESTFDETAEWDLEVYDNMQGLKLKKNKVKGQTTTINTQSWKEGVYMIRASYKGEILTGKLVVKK